MSDTGTVGAAGKSAVGDQRHAVSQTAADDITCGSQHFLHTGTAFGTFITDDHHVAGLDLSGQDAFAGFFLTFKNDGRASVGQHLGIHPRRFDDRTSFGKVSEKDGKTA